jgi:hypothetical protein
LPTTEAMSLSPKTMHSRRLITQARLTGDLPQGTNHPLSGAFCRRDGSGQSPSPASSWRLSTRKPRQFESAHRLPRTQFGDSPHGISPAEAWRCPATARCWLPRTCAASCPRWNPRPTPLTVPPTPVTSAPFEYHLSYIPPAAERANAAPCRRAGGGRSGLSCMVPPSRYTKLCGAWNRSRDREYKTGARRLSGRLVCQHAVGDFPLWGTAN